MEENFRNIYKAIQEADALLIGASNGLSISEGYNIFADDHWFQKDFGDFRSRYGIRNIYCRDYSFSILQKNLNGHFSAD